MDWGLLADDDQQWVLTENGRQIANENPETARCLRIRLSLSQTSEGDALIADTYRLYPYYAIRSENRRAGPWMTIGRRLIGLNPTRPQNNTRRGYSRSATKGGRIEVYLNLLIRARASTLLCDVRRNAISRKYGFSKTTLERACTGVGIRYEHLPELGIESWRRRGLKTEADFKDLFKDL